MALISRLVKQLKCSAGFSQILTNYSLGNVIHLTNLSVIQQLVHDTTVNRIIVLQSNASDSSFLYKTNLKMICLVPDLALDTSLSHG